MSLKAFHLFFIIICILFALGFAAWNLVNYFSAGGRPLDLVIGLVAVAIALGLAVYERYFLKKLKKVSFL